MKNVAVFCGARQAPDEIIQTAKLFMQSCHSKKWGLVYGGGHVGLMGIFADEMLRLGGEVIGVIPEYLVRMEVAHKGLTDLRVVSSMHTRKREMYDESDAFVIFPGGIGTLDEFFEILTWKQLGKHEKPIAMFNPEGYFDGLLLWFERAVKDGFYTSEQMGLFRVCKSLEELNDFLDRCPA